VPPPAVTAKATRVGTVTGLPSRSVTSTRSESGVAPSDAEPGGVNAEVAILAGPWKTTRMLTFGELTPSDDAKMPVTPVSTAKTRPLASTVATASLVLRQTTGMLTIVPSLFLTVGVICAW
jgi:hypothetical protein